VTESEDDNCGIPYEEREDEDLADFDQLNENRFKELDRFPKADELPS
jgi:hypothetical protein